MDIWVDKSAVRSVISSPKCYGRSEWGIGRSEWCISNANVVSVVGMGYRQQDVRYQSRRPKNEKWTFPYFLSLMKPGSELKE